MEGLADFMLGFGRVSARCEGAHPFLAELNGHAVATGMLFIYEDVCILAGASTVPEGRNRGAQNALLGARLASLHRLRQRPTIPAEVSSLAAISTSLLPSAA